MTDLPVSDKIRMRPVWARYLRRIEGFRLDPPTDSERRDAIQALHDIVVTDTGIWSMRGVDLLVVAEAQRILDEADGLPPQAL